MKCATSTPQVQTAAAALESAVKATRQLRALAVVGCSTTEVGADTGVDPDLLARLTEGREILVNTTVAAAIGDAFERLCGRLIASWPAAVVPGGDTELRQAAIARGWVGPFAWDEDTIGDVVEQPNTDGTAGIDYLLSNVQDGIAGRVTYTQLTKPELIEVVTILAARGWSDPRIGEHLSWPASPKDKAAKHSPLVAYRRRNSIPSGHPLARQACLTWRVQAGLPTA